MNRKRLLLLNGSPRKAKTSYVFARTIKHLAEKKGHKAEIIHIIEYFDEEKHFDALKDIILPQDILGLITPLYVDTLPYPVIWFLEKLSCDLAGELKGKEFFAVAQCGFPDADLLHPLLESCRYFAKAVEMRWLGGLGYGGGALIDGTPLEKLGRKGKKIISAFTSALDDIVEGKNISPSAQGLLTAKIPKILYRPLAAFLNYRKKREAYLQGVSDADLTRKTYLENYKL
ncbi:MAG: NAD(P)H-dependent oxidoreductase [Firmicutes bacterium]|nr:NAD(P)H-dependent oxidoreductase [Bacillota bacterium]